MVYFDNRVTGRSIALLIIAVCSFVFGTKLLAKDDVNLSLCNRDALYNQAPEAQEIRSPALPEFLSREKAISDINYLTRRLEVQSSYLWLGKLEYKKALDCLKYSLGEKANTLQFARNLNKIIMQIGDTHAKLRVSLDAESDRYLPFIIADTSGGIAAIDGDGKRFLDEKHPFIKSIDGKSISQLLDLARKSVPQGSPQSIRRGSLRELRSIDRIRMSDGEARTPFVNVVLQSADGKRLTELRLKTRKDRLPGGKLALRRSQILEANIGYLRISSMSNSKIENIISSMSDFQNTDGLIIDVRGNRGGKYGILRALYGYFVAEDPLPYVTNIAAYRLSPRFERDYLHRRHTYRMEHPAWTPAEKRAIKNTLASFNPEFLFPMEKFSTWHFMILGKSSDSRQYRYRKPVVVLSNAASFSATDGFLSAFADLPAVVLIGQASSGGSGATRYFTLQNSRIEVLLSTMVSFRPNGKLFDGNGIEVDISVMPAPGDFLCCTDAVMDIARAWIMQASDQSN